MGEILRELPAVILRGSVLLPGVVSHFDISARKSIHAVEAAMNGDNCIFLVTQKDMQTENAKQDDVYAIGVIAEIKQIVKMQNHIVRVIVEAKEKAELAYFIDNDELLKAQVVLVEESEEKEVLAPEVEEAMPVYGCYTFMSNANKDLFHTPVPISNLSATFSPKMYFWPIKHSELKRNKLLTQNPGWTYND